MNLLLKVSRFFYDLQVNVLLTKKTSSSLSFPLSTEIRHGTHKEKANSLTSKFIQNHFMVVTSLVKHTLLYPPSQNIQNLLNYTSPPSQGCHSWMGAYVICIYIASYTHSFLLSLALMYFLHCMVSILRCEKVSCEVDESIALQHDPSIGVIFLGVHFPFYGVENCVSFGLLVFSSSLNQSAQILLVNLLQDFSGKLFLPVK